MKTRTRISLPGLLFLLLTIFTGLYLYQNLKKEEYTSFTQAKGAAKHNQYLALEMLLTELTYSVNSLRNEDISLPENNNAVVFISDKKIYQNTEHLNELAFWVNNGGSLIITAYFPGKNADDIQLFPDVDIYSGTGTEVKIDDNITVNFEHDLDISHTGVLSSSYETSWQLVDEHGVHAASYKVGSGNIVVFNNLAMFNNHNISNKDHAEFLISLLNATQVKNFIHIQLPRNKDFTDLIKAYPFPFYLLSLLLILSVWYFWGHFGPVKGYLLLKEKLFITHLQYTGKYLWQHGDIERLYTDLFNQALSQILLKHPDWETKSDEEKINMIMKKTELDTDAIHQTIFYKAEHNKYKFLTFSRNITIIRDSL